MRDPSHKLQDLMGASPDLEKTYSIIAYILYNGHADAVAGYQDDTETAVDVPAG